VLIAAITFVVTASSGRTTIFDAAFRSFLIFAAVAVLGGIVLVVIVMVLSDVRRKQAEEMRERMEREQREFLETQMRFQDELNKIDRDANS
jgi:flagellar biosynthesis/type III secretory pathway M-ring protein FliF/YscJ